MNDAEDIIGGDQGNS